MKSKGMNPFKMRVPELQQNADQPADTTAGTSSLGPASPTHPTSLFALGVSITMPMRLTFVLSKRSHCPAINFQPISAFLTIRARSSLYRFLTL